MKGEYITYVFSYYNIVLGIYIYIYEKKQFKCYMCLICIILVLFFVDLI